MKLLILPSFASIALMSACTSDPAANRSDLAALQEASAMLAASQTPQLAQATPEECAALEQKIAVIDAELEANDPTLLEQVGNSAGATATGVGLTALKSVSPLGGSVIGGVIGQRQTNKQVKTAQADMTAMQERYELVRYRTNAGCLSADHAETESTSTDITED